MILVSGASGFLGSAIVSVLGDRVITIGRTSISGKKYVICDLTNPKGTHEALEQLKDLPITHLVHLAAITPWTNNPDYELDITMAHTVSELCNRLHISTLIFLSGWNVYSPASQVPITEYALVHPDTPYGVSKSNVESYFTSALSTTKLICLRASSVYGPGQVSAGLIPNLVNSALATKTIHISAKDTRRDYIYISDISRVINNLVTQDISLSGAVNVGGGVSISVEQVAKTIATACSQKLGSPVTITYTSPLRESNIPDNLLDISKAQAAGLLSTTTPFSEGIKKYIDWRAHESIS